MPSGPNPILDSANTTIAVSNFDGYKGTAPDGSAYTLKAASFIPLTTADGSATGRIVVPVLAVGSGSGGAVQVSEIGEASFLVTRGTANAGGTSTLAARATRRAVSIYCNPTSPEAVYFGATTGVTTATGAQLNAGQGQVVDTIAALFLCSAAGTGTYTLVEEYD